jgi:hypothetical protein
MSDRPLRSCRFFLAILILLLLLFPVLEEMARPLLLVAMVASVFVAGVVVVQPGRRRVRSAVALAAIQVMMTAVAVVLPVNSLPYLCTVGVALGTTASLIGYCIYCVSRYVLQANCITRDQIYAGICVYLMLGFAFGCIYYLLSLLDRGAFAVNSTTLAGAGAPDLMYFSFVTLATLGYGDITPVTKAARSLAELEALGGMLYIAIFMARLVTLYSAGADATDFAEARETDKLAARSAGEHRHETVGDR